MNLSKFDKSQNRGSIDFSTVMDVQAVIFTTPDAAKSQYTTSTAKTSKKGSLAADNPNK